MRADKTSFLGKKRPEFATRALIYVNWSWTELTAKATWTSLLLKEHKSIRELGVDWKISQTSPILAYPYMMPAWHVSLWSSHTYSTRSQQRGQEKKMWKLSSWMIHGYRNGIWQEMSVSLVFVVRGEERGIDVKDSILKLGRHIVKDLLEGWLQGNQRPSARIGLPMIHQCPAFAADGSVTDNRFAKCLTEPLPIPLLVRDLLQRLLTLVEGAPGLWCSATRSFGKVHSLTVSLCLLISRHLLALSPIGRVGKYGYLGRLWGRDP